MGKNGANPWVPFEVFDVEGENVSDAVNVHRGHKPCIVDFHPRYSVCNHEAKPLRIDTFSLWKHRQERADTAHFFMGFGDAHAESVCATFRPSRNAPKLGDVLWRHTHSVSSG